MSEYRRRQAFFAGQKAFALGKPKSANNRMRGTIFYDDWADGWMHADNESRSVLVSDNSFVEYRPPADGVAPPYWREGEALIAPNEDAMKAINQSLDEQREKWKAADAADIASMVESLRAYPADELAKHGITLSEPKDDFEEVSGLVFDVAFGPKNVAVPRIAGILRERVVLKEGV